MASPAAVLSVLVKAEGIARTNAQLQGLHGDLGKSSKAAGKLGTDLDRGTRTGSKALAGLKSAAGLAGLAVGAAGLAGAVKDSIGEYREAQKVGAQTNAVIKSTGGAAGVSAKHVGELATAISKKAGIDDEAIQSGSNLLLTFKGVRNEVGKGNNIFDQATQTITDMSVSLKQGLKPSAIQVGKALNDPVKGITALGRVGVQFTEGQKKMIAGLVKSGDTLGAQKIILKELKSEFGGSAAAAATAGDHLSVSFKNLEEALGSVLVPAIDKVATVLSALFDQMVQNKGIGGAMVSTFKSLGGAIGAVVGVIAGIVAAFKESHGWAVLLVAAVGALTAGFVAYKTILLVSAAATKVMAAAQVLMNVAMTANPIGLVIAAIAGLVAGLIVAYEKSKTFRDIVNSTWDAVKTAANVLWSVTKTVFGGIVTVVTGAWTVIKSVTIAVWNAIKVFLIPLWELLKTLVTTYFGIYKAVIVGTWNAVKTVTVAVWGAISTVTVAAWNGLKSAAGSIWGAIRSAILAPIRAVRDLLGGKDGIWAQMRDAAHDAWEKIKTGAGNFAGDLKDAIIKGFEGGVNAVIDFVNKIIDVINVIPGIPNIKHIGHVGGGGKGKGSPGGPNGTGKLAKGGMVPGSGYGDKVPLHIAGKLAAMVEPGELVSVANRNATAALMSVNNAVPRFAGGGVLNSAEMADLWRSKGGSASKADTMGVIGLVESGGNPLINNGGHVGRLPGGGKSIAAGLWQILGLPFAGDVYNPGTNARMAISKSRNGVNLHPWDASRSKWEPLLGKKVGPDPLDLINKLPGIGDLPDWLKGTGKYVISHVGDWIKDNVAKLIPGGGSGGTKGPKGVGTFNGIPMADWVIDSLNYGRKHGAYGNPTSGYRPGYDSHTATGASEHQGTQYPHGAVDFGGYTDARALAEKLSYVHATAGYKYPLLAPKGFHDDGHASGTGHQLGGIVGPRLPFLGAYHRGGVAPTEGYARVSAGERMTPAGSGPLVNIEHAEFGSQIDVNSFAAKLGFKIATA